MTRKIRILVVDDDHATRRLLRYLFEEAGFEIVGEAENGQQAVEMALECKPDVVTMDLNMPIMNGIDATRIITQKAPSIRIIIITGFGTPSTVEISIKAGACAFMAKPIGLEDLLTTINRVHEQKPSPSEIEQIQIAELRERLDLYAHDVTKGCLLDQIDRLVAGIAHDLRSPLGIVLSTLGTIDVNANDVTFVRHLERIRRRSLYCKWIVDNFLGVSFSENITLDNISLIDVIQETLQILENKIHPNIHLSIHVPEDLRILGSSNLLRLILMNIIENAIEAMTDGGALDVSAHTIDSHVHIVIADTGVGISSDKRQKLFSIGFTTKPAHCGLGLYIAQRFARRMGGEIVYAEREQSNGSVFRLSVPLQPEFSLPKEPSKLRANRRNLERKLTRIRDRSVLEVDRVLPEFQRIVSTFASNLYNELNVIEVTAKNLLSESQDDSLKNALNKIIQSCTYARLLTRNMAELGKTPSLHYSFISPIEIIEEVLELLERKIPPEYYKVEWEIDPTLGDIEADSISLKQVFMNLIRNALEAMPDGGVLKLNLAREGQTAVITVSDTGKGIAPEYINRLFTIGFTTKQNGYGLGLYNVMSIIKKHKGTISVSSRPGKGTTFVIRLPIKQTTEEATYE
jgi:signal transduction histidine kinase